MSSSKTLTFDDKGWTQNGKEKGRSVRKTGVKGTKNFFIYC